MADGDDDSVSELLGLEAAPIVIEHGGRKYKARNLHEGPLSEWERWLRDDYREQAVQTTGDPDRADDMTARAGVARAFRWGGDLSRAALRTPAGGVAFAALVFRCTEARVKELSAAQPARVRAALEQVIAESFPDQVPPRQRTAADAPLPSRADAAEDPVPNPPSAAPAST